MPYYGAVERWTNSYAIHLGLGGTYGHSFRNVTAKEFLRHDACVVRDGICGGSSVAIYRRMMHGCSDYDDAVYEAQIPSLTTHASCRKNSFAVTFRNECP